MPVNQFQMSFQIGALADIARTEAVVDHTEVETPSGKRLQITENSITMFVRLDRNTLRVSFLVRLRLRQSHLRSGTMDLMKASYLNRYEFHFSWCDARIKGVEARKQSRRRGVVIDHNILENAYHCLFTLSACKIYALVVKKNFRRIIGYYLHNQLPWW